ncbi:MAG: hypothetical protein ABW067_16450 [Rhizobacter sp.]
MSHEPRRRQPAPDLQEHFGDIQGILKSAFIPLRHGVYRLFEVTDPVAARAWLGQVMGAGLVKSVKELGRNDENIDRKHLHDEIAMLAFSHEGLGRLGLVASGELPFPAPFVRGPRQQPSGGRWPDRRTVHVLLAHYHDGTAPGHALLRPGVAQGLTERLTLPTCPSFIGPGGKSTEPFGFRDGIAQPRINGLHTALPATGPFADDPRVAPGEFILGHPNEYGELAYCPDVVGWPGDTGRFAMNGSYLAVQQIQQHVRRFRDFEARQPAVGRDQPTLTEKMVGRYKDGSPLVACPVPNGDPAHDQFRYRTEDFDGLQCPRGAHVRRANPRDMLGWDVESGIATAKLHRLLRRGRVYAGDPGAPDPDLPHVAGDPGPAEGLFFMALNADLDRQFELVESRWLVNRRFADLSGEDDVAGSAPPERAFTVQGLPTGERHDQLSPFTTLLGSGYFFVPSIAALKFIAGA